MVFDAYDDYEQNERVQKWLRQNGVSIVVGIIIGLVAIFGWQQWRSHRVAREVQAAETYRQLQAAILSGRDSDATQLTDDLMKNDATSSYALFAANDQARRQVGSGQLKQALASLEWASEHAKANTLKWLMQLRIARVQLALGEMNKSIETLNSLPAQAFRGEREELRGDALVKLGRLSDARRAYQFALLAAGVDAPQRAVLQLKLDDLAVAGKQGA